MTTLQAVSKVFPDSVFCAAIAVAHRRSEPEMASIVASCDPHGTAVDVGAWYGPWSFWLRRRVDSVVAFEPNPRVAAALRRSVGAGVDVRELALSDRAGHDRLVQLGRIRGEEGGSHLATADEPGHAVDVESSTLDAQGLDRVRLVKIDVEGHELEVVSGGLEVIDRWHPVLVVETEARHGDVHAIFELTASLGYTARVLVDGRWTRIGADELTNLQQRRPPQDQGYLAEVLHAGTGYVRNVVFAHPSSTWVPW